MRAYEYVGVVVRGSETPQKKEGRLNSAFLIAIIFAPFSISFRRLAWPLPE
jgi:hypothetical protein